MPVIIQEIQITTQVGGSNQGSAPPRPPASGGAPAPAADNAAVIAACVEEVMRILHEKEER
jgi:hypothetical protein